MTRRKERINELLREEISDLLRRETKDPRLGGFLTVTEVSVSADLKHARVFVSILGTEDEWVHAREGLLAAASFLRKMLGVRLSLRYIPELSFERDQSIERGSHLLDLINQVSPHPGTGETETR